jgi:hypothetical protein
MAVTAITAVTAAITAIGDHGERDDHGGLGVRPRADSRDCAIPSTDGPAPVGYQRTITSLSIKKAQRSRTTPNLIDSRQKQTPPGERRSGTAVERASGA